MKAKSAEYINIMLSGDNMIGNDLDAIRLSVDSEFLSEREVIDYFITNSGFPITHLDYAQLIVDVREPAAQDAIRNITLMACHYYMLNDEDYADWIAE